MGCGSTRFQVQGNQPLSQKNKKLNKFYETKEIGIQTSYNNLYDKLESEKPPTPKQVRTEGVNIHVKPINNPVIRRNTMRHESTRVLKKKSSFFHQKDNEQNKSKDSDIFSFDNNNGGKTGQLEKSEQLQGNKQNSNNSQEFDSPFGQQRNNDSENKIDIQNLNSNNNSIQNSVGRDHLNSPSLANQTANFFKNGENDNFSSREYNNSSPQIFSNNIIPETANKNIIERQNNRTPTLSKPSSLINPTFSNDYILVGGIATEQNISGLGNGIIVNHSNQYGKQLSQISEEKEMSLLTNHIRRTNQKKSSIKVDNDSNNSQSDNNLVQGNATSRGSANITTADQTSPQNCQGLNGTIINAIGNYNNNAFNNQNNILQKEITCNQNNQINANTNKAACAKEQQNDVVFNENNTIQISTQINNKSNNLNKEENDQNEEKINKTQSQDPSMPLQQQKSNGSFRIKKNMNTKSVSVHTSPNEIIEKSYQKQNSLHKNEILNQNTIRQNNFYNNQHVSSHDFVPIEQQNNPVMQSRDEQHSNIFFNNTTSPKKQNTINNTPQSNQKSSINLIDYVKNQQLAQRETFRNNQQSIYNHFRQFKQPLKQDSDKLNNINLQDDYQNLQSAGLKQTRKLSRLNPRMSQNITKFVSPKTNLIEFVQQMQYKSQRNSSVSLQSPFLFQSQFQPQNYYDQNMEIDGLSPISSNVNPNFRGGYDYDVEDEEVARQMENDKSNMNIASMTNFQNSNNSSSYEEQRGAYSPYSKEQSQTISVLPSIINGSEFCDNSKIDFDKYDIEYIDGYDGVYKGQNNLLSSKLQHSQILNSQLFSQQNVVLPSSIANSQSVYQNSKTQPSNKQLPSQSGIHSQVIGSMNSLKVNSPQLTGLIYQNIPNLQKRSVSAAPNQSQMLISNQQQNGNANPQFKKVFSEFDSSPISQNQFSHKYSSKKVSKKESISPKTDGKQILNFTQSSSTHNQAQTSLKDLQQGKQQIQNQNQEDQQNLNKNQNSKQINSNYNFGQISSSQNIAQQGQIQQQLSLQQQQLQLQKQQQQQQQQFQQQLQQQFTYETNQKLYSQNSNLLNQMIQQSQLNNQNPIQLRKQSSSSRRSNQSIHQPNRGIENKNNQTSNTNESKSSVNQSSGNGFYNSSDKKGVPLIKSLENKIRNSINSSPSKNSSNHLSPTYATDKKFVRSSNRKTTMEVKDIIRKRSDSSLSQNSNDSLLTNQENMLQKEKPQATASQFQKLYKGNTKENAEIQLNSNQELLTNDQVEFNNQGQAQNNKKQDQVNPAQIANKQSNNTSVSSNQQNLNKLNSNEVTNKNSSKNTTNQTPKEFTTSNSNSSSAQQTPQNKPINLIQLAKQNVQISQQGDQIKQQQLYLQQYQQQLQQKIINNKKTNLIVLQNPTLLNSLYNISEEPNEQYTDMQSKSNFDFASSINGRSQLLDQTQNNNSNYKPTQNLLLSNFSLQTQKDLNKKASIEQFPHNLKNQQNTITQPSVSILLENNSTNNAIQSQSIVNQNQTVKNISSYGKEIFSDKQKVTQSTQQITNHNGQQKDQKNQNLLDLLTNNISEQKEQSQTTKDLQKTNQLTQQKAQINQHQTTNHQTQQKSTVTDKIQIISEPIQTKNDIKTQPQIASKEKVESQSILISNILKSQEEIKKETESASTDMTTKKQEEQASKTRIQEIIQREKKRENSQKKIQQITQPTQSKSKMNFSQTPSMLPQMSTKLSNNNLSVNSTVLNSSNVLPSQTSQSNKKDKYQKLSKANTANISKNLSYSMLQEQHSVLETSKLDKSVNADGQKQINNYIILKNIGHGAFGKVKQVFDTNTKKHFAVKIINRDKLMKKKLDRNKSAFSLIEKEIAICKKMAHPNIVKLYEYIDDQDEAKIYMIMDLLKKGSINSKSYWKTEKGKEYKETEKYNMSEQKLKKYFRDFLLGLDYLHNFVNVVHRDIKPDNLLIGDEDQLKIADFGVSQMFEGEKDELNNDNGTKCYLAPEAFTSNGFNGRPLDIWAAGVSLYEIFTGSRPFNGRTLEVLKKSILETEPNYPSNMSPEFVSMLQKCLNKDPKKRADVQALIVDDWVTDKGQNPLEFPIYEGDFHDIKDDELKNAITKSFLNKRVNIQAKLKEKIVKTRINIEKKKSFQIEEDVNNNTLNVNKL
ncbi:Serine/Threonine kinase domain protein (macronuclear) [Tetrahymena thermophila SB210]|uniref:Serine/Threonine kinase domain protein n=1 Tax=Tetrahymena thermophila (strain SB210) TaxID=312017 RepID=Q23RK4_TETTS|nr:Serine/Threonine kinase domain protein [Tetrahymena thermophila SB210]EAR99044.2 Serine/Threonine kinase domain protein [Tetrahymena thermophila SB210]|eukprot:XP_001019289.2 Serine/Threonine kinase domain protein [Tetrahymena thermophila SB210]